MKRTVETNDTLIPPSQLEIIRIALDSLQYAIGRIEGEDSMIFDCKQLSAIMNYPVYVDVPEEVKENFVHLHGVDFPKYVYEKKERFFLFGLDAVNLYQNNSTKDFLSALSDYDYEIFCYTEGYNDPTDLLMEFEGWGGYTIIPKDVYLSILKLH